MIKHLSRSLFLLTFSTFFALTTSFGQVVVNEFCFANYSDWTTGGDNEDWVEFYNPGAADVSLEGYWLSDNLNNIAKFELPADAIVPANGYLLVLFTGLWDANPNWAGYINTNFKLTQTAGESLIFAQPDQTILESWTFGVDISPNQANHSRGRTTDGGNTWMILTNPSPGAANGGASGLSYASAPIFSDEAGYYAGGLQLTLSSPDPGVEIHYTTDGSEPDNGDMLYSGPINVDQTMVVRAICYDTSSNVLPGWVETNTYFVGSDTHTIPIFSISGATLSDGLWIGDELTVLEMFDTNGNFVVEAVGDSNEHGNDSNAYGQRGFDYVTRDALGYDNEVEEPIFHHRSRNSFERLIFKAAANDNASFETGGAHVRDAYCHELSILADLQMDERATEFCIVYINGEYWGVYDVREKADDIDFTKYYYNQPQNFVDYLKTWGGTWEEYGPGCLSDWNTLKNFILSNDMTDPTNYEFVTNQYNQTSLIDYFILNSYCVTTDWLNWNTAWWKGNHPDGTGKRWKYVLWDLDATFGHYINYTGVPDTTPQADPCNPESLNDPGGQGHVPIMNALMTNDDFLAEYINRYATMSNSYFSCDYMLSKLDSMVDVIDPEMVRQFERWGFNYAGWQDNVQEMRDFIIERCADEIVSGMEDCYDIVAVNLTVIVDGPGTVELEGLSPLTAGDSPWSGIYYSGVPLDLEAIIDPGYFVGWEVLGGDLTIDDPFNPNLTISMTGDITLVAHFVYTLDPQMITFDVVPDGAGDIYLDAMPVAPYPNSMMVDGGVHDFEATENPWFVFDHWETNNAIPNPSDADAAVSMFVLNPDTIVAVFTEIPHFDLLVDVSPAGTGTISMNGSLLPSYPWTGVVEGDVDISFSTTSNDMWNVFSHWEINNNVILPNNLSADIILNLTESDELVAVYTVFPHQEITVIVDPPFSGTVSVDAQVDVQSQWTGELPGEHPVPFVATPTDYWNFKGWSSNFHFPSPDEVSREVIFNFSVVDTVWAHFEPEAFSMYIPNSFSPNNDGINDLFLPVGNALDVTDYSLKIFNRWGELVFATNDPTEGWNGSHQGGGFYVSDELYTYYLTVKSVHNLEEKEFSGHIMVFR